MKVEHAAWAVLRHQIEFATVKRHAFSRIGLRAAEKPRATDAARLLRACEGHRWPVDPIDRTSMAVQRPAADQLTVDKLDILELGARRVRQDANRRMIGQVKHPEF